ncbi:MAG: hypothetical protein V1736_12490 [Pseudomonadota bacterium]
MLGEAVRVIVIAKELVFMLKRDLDAQRVDYDYEHEHEKALPE